MHSQIIEKMKASGIFDQFRKDCIADVDTKPAYINLHTRVNQSVDDYLKNIHWSSKMVRISVRDGMRKHIMDSSYFTKGVDRVVNQAVDPKINTAFFPIVENVVYEFLGLQKPKQGEVNEEFDEDKKCWEQPMDIDPPQESTDADEPESKPVFEAPEEIKLKAEEDLSASGEHDLIIVEDQVNEDEEADDDAVEDDDEEESPPFEAIGVTSPPHAFPGAAAIFAATSPKPVAKSSDTEALVTDFSNYFSKPELEKEQLSNDSPGPLESNNCQTTDTTPTTDNTEQSKSSAISSNKDSKDRGSSSTKASPSDKDKPTTSSSKERTSSSSHSYSKSKSDSSHHSKHRDKDRETSSRDKANEKEKDKYRRESSSKHSSRASQSKHSRHSSHSTSSRRHSSDSRSKDSGRTHSDKHRKSSDDKNTSSSKQSHKEYKSSSSSRRETSSARSHSSSRKDYDKHKHSSVSSSRISSSSRSSDHDHRSGKTKSSGDDKERSDSQRNKDSSATSKKMKTDFYEPTPARESETYNIVKQQSPNMDSTSNNTEQLSPDINEGGLGVVQEPSFPVSISTKLLSADQEETALDKWYSSGNENENCSKAENFTSIGFGSHHQRDNFDAPESSHGRTPLNPAISVDIEDDLSQSSVQRSSDEQEKSKDCFPESISAENISVKSTTQSDSSRKVQQVSVPGETDLDELKSDDFNMRRSYFSNFMDPLFDERSVPMPALNNQLPISHFLITLDDCAVNDNMVMWLRKNGARVHLKL